MIGGGGGGDQDLRAKLPRVGVCKCWCMSVGLVIRSGETRSRGNARGGAARADFSYAMTLCWAQCLQKWALVVYQWVEMRAKGCMNTFCICAHMPSLCHTPVCMYCVCRCTKKYFVGPHPGYVIFETCLHGKFNFNYALTRLHEEMETFGAASRRFCATHSVLRTPFS